MPLSPGDRVDRYEVLDLLGSGGMGEVYRARDPKLARLVALKVVRVDRAAGTDGAARLLREARAAAALTHPNVLAIYDVGEVAEPEALRGTAYIAMELVVGQTLRARIGDAGVPLARRLGWLKDVARALGAAHAAGIVHRDVKPENVMIAADGTVKVLDFGIARRAPPTFDAWSSTEGHSLPTDHAARTPAHLPTLTQPHAVVGTPYFMAPEQLRGEALDARADQFAWAVMAYWVTTGRGPWAAADKEPVAILSQILSLDPPPASSIDPAVPESWSRAIGRALAKRREDRFSSMAALLEAVDAEGPPREAPAVLAAPAAERAPVAAAGARRAALAGAAAVAALAVVAAAGWSAWKGRAREGAASSVAPSPVAIAGACATNAECVAAHGGEPWRCHSKRRACVPLASEGCTVHAEPGDAATDDVVWFGGIFPLNDPGLVYEVRAADLARQDFARALGPAAGRAGPLHARPFGLVVCDEAKDARTAARHLVDDVEVPAVLGFRSATTAFTVIANELLPNRVLSMVTISQAPTLTRIPEPAGEPRLVWRSTLNRVDAARPLAALVAEVIEPALRADPHGIGRAPLRVATVWTRAANHDVGEALFAALRFNGKSALENEGNFRQLVGDPDADGGADALVDELVAFAPHVVVYSDPTFYRRVLGPLEARWRGGPRPTYLTEGAGSKAVSDFVGADATRRRRFFGVTNLSTTMTNAQLVLRYNVAFPDDPITRVAAPQPSYDAFYLLADATLALGDAPVTGPALARAMARLVPPGRPIDVGPAGILDAFETLRSGGNVDLNGALGALDFDLATGEAPIAYAIVCPGVDERGRATASVDSGLVYDARAQKLTGALRCP